MAITIAQDGRRVLEAATLADLKALADAPHSADRSTFKIRHYVADALKEADEATLKSDAALLLKIVKHLKQYGIVVNV